MSRVLVKRVESEQDWKQFIELPWKIYSNSPNWVPPLKIAVRDQLSLDKNPFFKHAYQYPLLAYRGQEVVGRVVGVIDDNHNRFHEESAAFFGYFETIEDREVARALIDEVARWAISRGMALLRGPINLSTNHEAGLLIEGFDQKPNIMMMYNPAYYQELVESQGFQKCMDLYAWDVHHDGPVEPRLHAHAERLKARADIKLRPINLRKFDQELEIVLDIYNDAWEKNWGFVPMEPEEFRHMAKDMKAIIDPNILLIAEVGGVPAAFSLALPDVNQVFAKVPDGKLFPTGLIKLLWNLKGPGKRKTINRCRILTLGIKQKYRRLALGPLMYAEYLKAGPANGYPIGEASWILETNGPMNKALVTMGAKKTKSYRIYEKPLS